MGCGASSVAAIQPDSAEPVSVGHLTPVEVVELRAVLLARGIPAANPLAAASAGKADSRKAAAAQAKLAAARQAALAAGEDLDVDAVIAQIGEFSGSTVLTDPRVKGNPIVWASAGFMRLTGYAKFQLLGKNCKFLQGRGTTAESKAAITEQLRQEREGVVRLLNYTSLGVAFENLVYVAPIRQNGRNTLYFGAHAAMPLWEDPKALDGKSKKGSSGKDKDKKKFSKKKSSAASDTGLLEEAPPTPSKAAKVKIASISSATSNISDLSGGGAGASTRSRSSSSGGERLISVASSSISAIASEQLFPLASRCRMRSQTTDQNKPFGESYRANTAPMFFMSTYLRGQLLIKTHTVDASASMAAATAAGVVESFAASAINTELQLQFELVRDVIGDRDDECFIGLELHEPLANDWAAHWVNKTLIATAREFRASHGGSSAASDGGDKSASAAASAALAPTVLAQFSAGRYRSNTISASSGSAAAAAASPSAKSPTAAKKPASSAEAFEYPHIVYPFGAMFDRVVVTDVESGGAEARQAMPALTLGAMTVPKSEFNQVYAGGDEELATLRPRPGFVYTMTVATGLFDLETWSLVGAPGSERLSISSVLGTATAGGVHLVCYTLLPPGKGDPPAGSQRAREHRLRERTVLFDIELSCAPPANEAQK